MEKITQLCSYFQDVNYAWQLLQAQISLQMSPIATGEQIAQLLQLYMRGVQKMNSIGDTRQSYFKNKVTSLMTKQTVIKSLKQNPMKKKNKHDQIVPSKQKQGKKSKQKQSNQQAKEQHKMLDLQQQKNLIELNQKKKQLEMRMAYVAQQHTQQSLKKMLVQQQHRQQNISNKINKIINSHEQRLTQRIKQRKLRTSTFRSRSQINLQQSQNQPNDRINKRSEIQDNNFSPFRQLKLQPLQIQNNNHRKRYKSLQPPSYFQNSQKRQRKFTFDQLPNRMSLD